MSGRQTLGRSRNFLTVSPRRPAPFHCANGKTVPGANNDNPGGIATALRPYPSARQREHQSREPTMSAAAPLPFTAWHRQRSPVQAWAWQTRGFNIQARHQTEVRHAVDPLQHRRASPPSISACLLWEESGHIVIKSAPGSATARDMILRQIRTTMVTSSSRQGVSL